MFLLMKNILDGNYSKLTLLIRSFEEDKTLWYMQNAHKLEIFQIEFLRCLHNYLASAHSIREHIKRFSGKINPNFKKECKIKWEKMSNNKAFNFFQQLRAFFHHRKIPFSSATFKIDNFSKDTIQSNKLNLEIKDLLNWKENNKTKWSKSSLDFINSFDKTMDIKEPLKIHHDLLVEHVSITSLHVKVWTR